MTHATALLNNIIVPAKAGTQRLSMDVTRFPPPPVLECFSRGRERQIGSVHVTGFSSTFLVHVGAVLHQQRPQHGAMAVSFLFAIAADRKIAVLR